MPETRRSPRFNLGTGMVLIAATGLGLAATRFVIVTVLGGRTSLTELFVIPAKGWTAYIELRRAQDLVSMLLPIFGGWTLVLPFLGRRPTRGYRSRLMRRPGVTACVSAIAGMILSGMVALLTALSGRVVDGRFNTPPSQWAAIFVVEHLLVFAGFAVAVAWAMQAMSGRWKPSTDWDDRAGRCLGVLWIAAGGLWATRRYMYFLI